MSRTKQLAALACLLSSAALAQPGPPYALDIGDFYDCVQDGHVHIALDPQDDQDCTVGGGAAAPHFCICASGTYSVDDVDPTLFVLKAGDTMTGALAIEDADPTISYEPATAGDTVFWAGVQENANSIADDTFEIGTGLTPGVLPILTVSRNFYDVTVEDVAFTNVIILSTGVGSTARITIQNDTNSWALDTPAGGNFRLVDQTNALAPFQIEPAAPSNSFRIDLAGQVGIGTATPTSAVDIDGGVGTTILEIDGSTGGQIKIRDTDDAGWTCCTALNGVLSCVIC